MNVDSILNYKSDSNEDFYELLGCDPSANSEQILAEYKVRAKTCHPDKNPDPQCQERFQRLLQAKTILTDPKERDLYDSWRSSGIAMKYNQWRSLKDSVKSSMHWATPNTSGRMIDLHEQNSPISLNSSPVDDKGESNNSNQDITEENSEDEIVYDPTPYEKLGLRMDTPPPEWQENVENLEPKGNTVKKKENASNVDPITAQRRRQFASRRESTIGAMVMAEKWEDNEIRRRFRNYEI